MAFESEAGNLGQVVDTNGVSDVYVRDRQTATTGRASVSSAGVQGNQVAGAPSVNSDGRFVAFGSRATNLVMGDTNRGADLFVRGRS